VATAKVKRVIDGDTFQIKNGEFIRLANVKAPELGSAGGQTAKTKLQSLLKPGTTVGIGVTGQSYGRLVAEVTKAGQSVNKAMQRKGYK
jgi:endonuclease YncB( thermonuclease family)